VNSGKNMSRKDKASNRGVCQESIFFSRCSPFTHSYPLLQVRVMNAQTIVKGTLKKYGESVKLLYP
jgi:hypothetical protein